MRSMPALLADVHSREPSSDSCMHEDAKILLFTRVARLRLLF